MDSQGTKQHVVSIQDENTTQSNTTNRWRDFFEKHSSTIAKVTLLLSLAAVALDPLFYYVFVVKNASTCFGLDNKLRIIVVFFRSLVDVLYIILWWHHRNLSSVPWAVAILAVLPLPQVVIFVVSWPPLTVNMIMFIVVIQLVLRFYRIFPAYTYAIRTSTYKLRLRNAWFAAAFNLVLYILASNVVGAFWYLRAVGRFVDCWKGVCNESRGLCDGYPWYCDDDTSSSIEYFKAIKYLKGNCSIPEASDKKSFDYGIYSEAYETKIIEIGTPFSYKFFQCFWWGLRSLSSLGQNLKMGNYIWDSFFSVSIAIFGLVLFALFIGNMQAYLQTIWYKQAVKQPEPAELERMKQRITYLEGWKPFRLLPDKLRGEVTDCEDPKWQEIVEVNLESLLNNTPTALREKLKPHLCKDMLEKIPQFKCLSDQQKQELRTLAKPVVFPERSYIFREGEPILEVVFIVDGNLWSYSKHSSQNRIPAEQISAGSFFGEELLQQLEPALGLPIASKTIQAETKVEAFALPAKDLISTYGKWAAVIQNA